jgi:DNA-binding transcriptional MocR family regulator
VIKIVQNYMRGRGAVNVADAIERAIGEGAVEPGGLLPTVRDLALSLSVSPATVASAYSTLRLRGLVSGEGRRGTRVHPRPPLTVAARAPIPEGVVDLASGNPDAALLPRLDRAVAAVSREPRLYGDDVNDDSLLELGRASFEKDGVPADNLTVVGGALDGIEKVLREHLRPGDRVAVEDPCFTGVLDLLGSLALVPVPVAIDDEGPLPDALSRALSSRVEALIVTPRAQNPFGSAITPARGRRLRSIVRDYPALLLVEDDHAGPIAGAPYQTLVSSRSEKWAAVRSVSKWLGPDLRVAFLAADPTTVARVEGRQLLGIRWISHILQGIVRGLWTDAAVVRKVARAEAAYTERREALLEALREEGIAAHGRSGLNVWIPVSDEAALVGALQARGWGVAAGARYRIAASPAIRVTIAAMSRSDARAFAADLAATLRPSRRSTV